MLDYQALNNLRVQLVFQLDACFETWYRKKFFVKWFSYHMENLVVSEYRNVMLQRKVRPYLGEYVVSSCTICFQNCPSRLILRYLSKIKLGLRCTRILCTYTTGDEKKWSSVLSISAQKSVSMELKFRWENLCTGFRKVSFLKLWMQLFDRAPILSLHNIKFTNDAHLHLLFYYSLRLQMHLILSLKLFFSSIIAGCTFDIIYRINDILSRSHSSRRAD